MNSIGRGIPQDNQHIIKQKVHLFEFLKTIKQNSHLFPSRFFFSQPQNTSSRNSKKKRIFLSESLTFYVSTTPQKEKKRHIPVKENSKLK